MTRRPRRLEDLDQIGVGLAQHQNGAGLDDPGLLPGDLLTGVAQVLHVVELDVGDHRHLAVDDVGGVPQATEAHLDDRDVDGDVGEPLERGAVDDLEVARLVGQEVFERGDVHEDAVEVVVGDRLAVPRHALVEALQVRARVGADREAVGREQRGDHARHAGLAVGAR